MRHLELCSAGAPPPPARHGPSTHLQHEGELAGPVVVTIGVQHSHEEPADVAMSLLAIPLCPCPPVTWMCLLIHSVSVPVSTPCPFPPPTHTTHPTPPHHTPNTHYFQAQALLQLSLQSPLAATRELAGSLSLISHSLLGQ